MSNCEECRPKSREVPPAGNNLQPQKIYLKALKRDPKKVDSKGCWGLILEKELTLWLTCFLWHYPEESLCDLIGSKNLRTEFRANTAAGN